jgi:predicted PurR-regulated permease PerM
MSLGNRPRASRHDETPNTTTGPGVQPPEAPPQPTTPALSDTRHDAIEAVTWQVRVAAAWVWRLLLIGAGLYILAKILHRIELVALAFAISLFLTAVLLPLKRLLRRLLPGPPTLPALLTLLIGVAVLVGIGWFVVWQISSHSSELANKVSGSIDKIRNWLHTGPLHIKSQDLDKVTTNITNTLKSHQGALVSGAITAVRTVAEVLAGILLTIFITFFLLRDGEVVWSWVLKLFPSRAQQRVDVAGRAGWGSFGGYMRGQVFIALFHGISIMILLFVLRVPLFAALGVLIFLGSFIPLIGLTITGAVCVAVALIEHGLTAAIVVTAGIVVLLQLEGHVLQPVIMSRSVDLHPLAIALGVSTATIVAGIPGALVAVPLLSFLNTTIRALRAPLPEAVAIETATGEPPPPGTKPGAADAAPEAADP